MVKSQLRTKRDILKNYKFAVLHEKSKHFRLVKTEEEVQRLIESGEIGDGDMVIELSFETLRLATLKNFIDLV